MKEREGGRVCREKMKEREGGRVCVCVYVLAV